MLRLFSLTIAVILASIVLGYGPVNVEQPHAASTHQTTSQVRHRVASSVQVRSLGHELRHKSLLGLLRDHVREEHGTRTAMWDDDDDDYDDVAPDTGIPSDNDDDLVMFDIDECLRSAATIVAFVHSVESTGAIRLDESRIRPASGYAELRERPPRLVRG